jgi:hypothetical protein
VKKHILYFAHPVNTYDTTLEKETLNLIQKYFPEFIIENPNQSRHQKGYAEWKERLKNTPSQGMNYFFDKVLPKCDAGTIALPFLDGKIGAGVTGETIYAVKKERGAWLIETPALEIIRPFTDEEINLLLEWEKRKNDAPNREKREKVENELVLSIKETRVYTWFLYNKVMKPYEQAHTNKEFKTE